jgi:hypothetical protein
MLYPGFNGEVEREIGERCIGDYFMKMRCRRGKIGEGGTRAI